MKAKDNPFSSERIDSLSYQPQERSWKDILEQLEKMHYRACVLGNEGTGKTAFLHDLSKILQKKGYAVKHILLKPESRRLPHSFLKALKNELGKKDIVLLDGADHMPLWQWILFKGISRNSGGLIITSHTRKMLPVLITCRTNTHLLDGIVDDLAADTDQELTHKLFREYNGNLRDVFRALYDLYAEA